MLERMLISAGGEDKIIGREDRLSVCTFMNLSKSKMINFKKRILTVFALTDLVSIYYIPNILYFNKCIANFTEVFISNKIIQALASYLCNR